MTLPLRSLAALGALALAYAQAAPAAEPAASKAAPFTLPALPYATSALNPVIDTQTMEIHHGRHHKAYVDNLNGKVGEFPALATLTLDQIQAKISTFDTAVRNNAGGHWNHSFFWRVMASPGKGGEPSAALTGRIQKDFGSVDAMKKAFNDAATKVFGSGWAWVIVTADRKLAVTTTANQDNPLMDVAATKGTPIVALDVWEHAYYLQYQNKRADYIAKWWDVVDWNAVNAHYDAAAKAKP